MGAAQRRKGAEGEREALQLVRSAGWPRAERNLTQSRDGGLDIVNGPEATVIEVKRRARRVDVPAAMRQAEAAAGAGELPVVLHRVDRERWRATLDAEELLALLALRERA
jgi:Holliday junction resolvase